jgi:catechol 2,3-dioxygenase-like lactoylglutathione lyase family enzyme
MTVKMLHAVPALPVSEITRSVEFFRDQLGFRAVHEEDGFAIVARDTVEVHLWRASDERWRSRGGLPPVVSGAESFLAGTASCRIGVEGIDEYHRIIQPLGVLHPLAPLTDQWYGTREFSVLDPDNNLITFFEQR